MIKTQTHMAFLVTLVSTIVFQSGVGKAQLTDASQTTPHLPGSAIGKSLEEQIGSGRGDISTSKSSIFLIKRDPLRAIRRGRQLFQRKFTVDQGLGPRITADSTGNIQNTRALGAGLVDSCAGCHSRPRGSAGFGGNVVTRPDSRDAPHLFGLGLIEQLADEITKDLRGIRDAAIAAASSSGNSVPQPLESKGISFGKITGLSDGSADTAEVEGVNPDLRIRPFFHEGETISMREFIVGALKAEMGLEAPDPLLCAATDSQNPEAVETPSGLELDPALDTMERPPVCDKTEDGDGDGVVNEVDGALIDHLEFYLLNYFKPGRAKVSDSAKQGEAIIKDIGCTTCHVQNLTIAQDRRVADVETQFNEEQGIFNRLFATVTPLFQNMPDEQGPPQLLPKGEPVVVENIFTDLKRHDLGAAFHEREYDGSIHTMFVTEPLWGVGSTAPYGHDGRSINLTEVILRHGGEAQTARDAYQQLPESEQQLVVDFLRSLVLFPPDDTASNLDPGDPAGDPQTQHGSINLGALFQIEDEGPE